MAGQVGRSPLIACAGCCRDRPTSRWSTATTPTYISLACSSSRLDWLRRTNWCDRAGDQLHDGIDYVQATIESVDLGTNVVRFDGRNKCELRRASRRNGRGANARGDRRACWSGMGGEVSSRSTHSTVRARSRPALANFKAGRIVVNVVDMPIKCPVAPLEFCFLADWFFREKGVRDQVALTYVTPLDGAFTKPVASRRLGELLAQKEHRGHHRVQHRECRRHSGEAGFIRRARGAVRSGRGGATPRRCGVHRSLPGPRRRAQLHPTDAHTLQSKVAPNIFAIGDAAGLPVSKAGSVTHFEGEVLTENIRRFLDGESLDASYDGHANCFIETGFGKAVLIDFNYDTEPLPGHFPDSRRPAAAEGVAPQPPRQADVPVVLLARAAAGSLHPRHRIGHADRRQTQGSRGDALKEAHDRRNRRSRRRRPQR